MNAQHRLSARSRHQSDRPVDDVALAASASVELKMSTVTCTHSKG